MSNEYEFYYSSAILDKIKSQYTYFCHTDFLVLNDLLKPSASANDDLFSRNYWNLLIDTTKGETRLTVLRAKRFVEIEDDLPSNHELIEYLKYGKEEFPDKVIEQPPEPKYTVYKENETKTLESFTNFVNSQASFIQEIGRYLLDYPFSSSVHDLEAKVVNWLKVSSVFPKYYFDLGNSSFQLRVPNLQRGKVNSLRIGINRSKFAISRLVDLDYLLRDVLISEKVSAAMEDSESPMANFYSHFADPGPRQIPQYVKDEIGLLRSSKLGDVFSEIRRISEDLDKGRKEKEWMEFQEELARLKSPK